MSHRAVLFSAMAEGTTRLAGVLDSADVRSTIEAVRALGAMVDLARDPDGALAGTVSGWGATGPIAMRGMRIECGNSGTTARLLMGVLAGCLEPVTLLGDASLSRRPMRRITEPLERMGVVFESAEKVTLPVTVRGTAGLEAIECDLPVASAQVKSAILLAGVQAHGRTCVSEPSPSRDHTELMLPLFGVPVERDAATHTAAVVGPSALQAADEFVVPRDPSSAAFLVAAAVLVDGSDVTLPGVSLNPTRDGFLRVLERMGAHVEVVPWPLTEGERVGEVRAIGGATLCATTVDAQEVPSLIDEVPILALVATQAAGTTRFQGVGELRVKESDRLAAIAEGIARLGGSATIEADTLAVTGPSALTGATLDSLGDHRLAMTWAVAGLLADGGVTVEDFEAVDVSYPKFAENLEAIASAGT